MNTGDIIRWRDLTLTVACVHGDVLHTLGHPERILPVESCTLVEEASEEERASIISALANSTSNNHRPRCARERQGYGMVGVADG